jgi:hypothetical protein
MMKPPRSAYKKRFAGSMAVASADLHLHHTAMAQAPRASTPTEVLAGLVDRVTFHNAENGFCVLRVKARGQRDRITVLGHAATISAGEFVQANGTWVNDRTHGVQFRASFLKGDGTDAGRGDREISRLRDDPRKGSAGEAVIEAAGVARHGFVAKMSA